MVLASSLEVPGFLSNLQNKPLLAPFNHSQLNGSARPASVAPMSPRDSGWQIYSVKKQTVNILGFGGHVVSLLLQVSSDITALKWPQALSTRR